MTPEDKNHPTLPQQEGKFTNESIIDRRIDTIAQLNQARCLETSAHGLPRKFVAEQAGLRYIVQAITGDYALAWAVIASGPFWAHQGWDGPRPGTLGEDEHGYVILSENYDGTDELPMTSFALASQAEITPLENEGEYQLHLFDTTQKEQKQYEVIAAVESARCTGKSESGTPIEYQATNGALTYTVRNITAPKTGLSEWVMITEGPNWALAGKPNAGKSIEPDDFGQIMAELENAKFVFAQDCFAEPTTDPETYTLYLYNENPDYVESINR